MINIIDHEKYENKYCTEFGICITNCLSKWTYKCIKHHLDRDDLLLIHFQNCATTPPIVNDAPIQNIDIS